MLLIPALVAPAADQTTEPQNVFPGDKVQEKAQVQGLSSGDTVVVRLSWADSNKQPAGCSSALETPASDASITGFSFVTPSSICPGLYSVTAVRQAASSGGGPTRADIPNLSVSTLQAKQALQVGDKPVVTGVSPRAFFQDDRALDKDKNSQYSLVFFGPSTLKAGPGDSVRIRDYVLPSCGTTQDDPPKNGKNCFKLQNNHLSDGEIEFLLVNGNGTTQDPEILKEFSGQQSLSLVHNGVESDPQKILFADASRTTPRDITLGVAAALVLLVYLLLSAGRKVLAAGSDKRTFLLTALFLDEQTQTYSLSKCQFYAWTLAAILGYVFLAVSKSVIQGSAVFPEIPEGLPGILMVSVGTGVLATTITNSKGTKGAGEVHPTLADFITSGGVVAPERLQFVVWTVVGIFTFLTIVFKSDPLTVQDLPRIPDGFLQLMGISSAGYLAGKLARKPGPVIKVLSVANVTPSQNTLNLPNQFAPPSEVVLHLPVLTLNIKGENLAPNALIKVDGQPLRGDMYWIASAPPDPQTGFCNELNVCLNNAAAYLEGTHTLTVVNADAQAADVVFPIDPMTIVSVNITAANPTGQDVAVAGTKFAVGSNTTAEWQDDNGIAIVWQDGNGNAKVATVTVQSDTQLKLDRPPAVTSTSHSKLILISPLGLKASKKL
jgi:hypothetical protein